MAASIRVTPNAFELREELAADHFDPLQQRVMRRTGAGRFDGAIEVVDHLEQVREDLAARALDVLRDLAPQPQPRVLEFGGRLPVLREVLLDLLVLLGDLLFELLDVGRLSSAACVFAGCIGAVLVRPPAAIDDLDRDLVFFV